MNRSRRGQETPLARSAIVLPVGLLLLNLVSLGLLVYRLTLPTDGWLAAEPDGFDHPGFIYEQNVLGLSAELQPGDWVTAVNDLPIDNNIFFISSPLAAIWEAGNTVAYSVQRGEHTFVVPVVLTHWPVRRLLAAVVFPDVGSVLGFIGTVAFVAISYYAFRQRPGNPATRALLLLSALLLSLTLIVGMLPQMLPDRVNPVVNVAMGFLIAGMFTVGLPPTFIYLALVFPRPKPMLSRYPWLAYLPYLLGSLVIVAFVMQAYAWGWIWTATAACMAILLLLHNAVTMRDAMSRGQLRWALGGAVLGFGLFALTFVNVFLVDSSSSPIGQLLSALSSIGFPVMGVGLAVAILRNHLFDIDLYVNRALVYGGLTLCVIATYVLVVGYLSFLFQTEANLVLSLIATGFVAVLLGRLQRWLQRGVNRLMYGARDEPYQLLTHLGQQLETALDPVAALSLTVETIAQALKLPYAAILLQQDGQLITGADYGTPVDEVSRFSLSYAGQEIGELQVASRTPHETFTPPDRRLLSVLAQQLGAAANAASLSLKLEQARLHLVTERGEARRRLGSDLHDGVGHQLVGVTQQLDRVMKILPANNQPATELLLGISQQLVALISEVRGLAHGLFPPELELLGLVGALRERTQAQTSFRVCFDAPEQLPPLPAEIENAVYYIALEALTNIEKHARAQNCRLCLGLSPQASTLPSAVLELDVQDDGCGLPAATREGLGLLSIQARAAEVGGSCRVTSEIGGGTAVMVRIPCPIQVE